MYVFGRYEVLFAAYASHADETPRWANKVCCGPDVLVDSPGCFETNFERINPDILSRLRRVPTSATCGWLVAGGAILRALLRYPPARAAWDSTDVDIFIWASARDGEASSEEAVARSRSRQATELAEKLFEALAVDGEHWVISRACMRLQPHSMPHATCHIHRRSLARSHSVATGGGFVINISRHEHFPEDPMQPPVQIILRLYHSPSEVLHAAQPSSKPPLSLLVLCDSPLLSLLGHC